MPQTNSDMCYAVIETQLTPNPNALKFVLDRVIAAEPASFFSAEAAADHPVARQLFMIPGVDSLLILNDFITINRLPTVQWRTISAKVRNALKKM